MSINICKIKPQSPMHLGTEGIGMEKTDIIIRSDTLASGIMAKYYEITGSKRNMENEPLFIISSAFPYCKDILFFPKPMIKPNIDLEDTGKKLKNIQFLSENTFIKWINEEKIKMDDCVFDEKFLLAEGKDKIERYLLDNKENKPQKIFYTVETSHNLLDRQTNRSEIFYIGEVKYNTDKDCGLYFFLDTLDEKENIRKAIEMLGKDGIGGKRTWGKGQFVSEIHPYNGELNFTSPSDYFVTLSLYIPEESEVKNGLLDGEKVAYNFERRGGWVGMPKYLSYRKKSVRMFTEGSVFKNVSERSGKIVDVRPEGVKHPVYKQGLALKVYIRSER